MNLKKIFFERPAHNFKAIDGIRAIAVLWVIIFHFWIFHHNIFSGRQQPLNQDYFKTLWGVLRDNLTCLNKTKHFTLLGTLEQ